MRPGVSPTTFLCCAICPLNKVKLFAALLFMKISFLREEGGGGVATFGRMGEGT